MRYSQPQMNKLIQNNKELQQKLKALMAEHDLEKIYAVKALYHAEVADGGKYQKDYRALD
ncbi:MULTISPECIES: hypothetical protein [Evansella]|uniref:Uncharacterized protein n=1 Tax=Evansella cellulosilytica (strain ATCC 21833 / DSM 2522 / FERM P-1141 / JCM 9156 / N-4) TaxID=649639 RepID=E6TR50_EVAC2|nr:hypothetical protein [Evansella cellulosilytica]ADU29426.1 hypothetical protein Bcell_1160 [Evansella cellulosilytica DSM 2522]